MSAQPSKLACCELMAHALTHAIIRTNPTRFGPDVLDSPLDKIHFCPWCGIETELTEAEKKVRFGLKGQPRYVWTDRKQPLPEALKTMTDDWIESGQYCDKTIMDLRDALRANMNACNHRSDQSCLHGGECW